MRNGKKFPKYRVNFCDVSIFCKRGNQRSCRDCVGQTNRNITSTNILWYLLSLKKSKLLEILVDFVTSSDNDSGVYFIFYYIFNSITLFQFDSKHIYFKNYQNQSLKVDRKYLQLIVSPNAQFNEPKIQLYIHKLNIFFSGCMTNVIKYDTIDFCFNSRKDNAIIFYPPLKI